MLCTRFFPPLPTTGKASIPRSKGSDGAVLTPILFSTIVCSGFACILQCCHKQQPIFSCTYLRYWLGLLLECTIITATNCISIHPVNPRRTFAVCSTEPLET
ncbi:hypothetical protein F4778DRAFT_763126 [Xylariomycetidae sp. FL2044]|nr:hypothetical protein F4778DRAFT_763126 [Xylariomycetidae sp. FL2044]